MNYWKGFFSALVACSLAACMTVPISGRKAFNIVPMDLENSLGAQSYAEMLSKEKVSSDPKSNEIVTRVGQRIAAVANQPDYKWEFKVIDSNVQNAFCLPGGKIAVYKGLLPVAKNEAGLATVMSHEVVHAIARHGGQRISANLGLVGGMVALQATALKNNSNAQYIMAALGLGAQVGLMLPYGRSHETEADEVGQILMARAGYDPSESVHFWERFGETTKGAGAAVPEFLSTHPSSGKRVESLKEQLPKAQSEYNKASNKYGMGEAVQ